MSSNVSNVLVLPGRIQPFEHLGVFGPSGMFALQHIFTVEHKVQLEEIGPTLKTKTKAPRRIEIIETYKITCTG